MAADPLLPIVRAHAPTGDRARLREAVVRAERVRGPLPSRDPAEARALWEALVAGRWSLVDHFERDGRRFVVAHRNAPGSGALRGLSARERRAAEDLGRGLAPKEIAWAEGVAPSTVANALGRARRKLGLGSLAELAALFAPSGLCTRLARVELAGAPVAVAVASGVLVDPERLAPLSAAEREVARYLVQGASNRAIAAQRGVAERTVANQVRAIYRKLGVASRAELAARLQGAIA